mmetsp:Transcript_27408/g.31272  ORF Transcript_27408/g.31272 Transcript_27408/m.31272 type:complete len:89 (-) Transcript_27408:512-778(-)
MKPPRSLIHSRHSRSVSLKIQLCRGQQQWSSNMKEILPTYYVNIYHSQTGQAFVTVSVSSYGSMITGEKDTEVETINNMVKAKQTHSS